MCAQCDFSNHSGTFLLWEYLPPHCNPVFTVEINEGAQTKKKDVSFVIGTHMCQKKRASRSLNENLRMKGNVGLKARTTFFFCHQKIHYIQEPG